MIFAPPFPEIRRFVQASTADRRARLLFSLAAALGAWCAALFAPPFLNDADTWWHVATGRWILGHGAVPQADPFSHTMSGAPWVAHEWLSELLMALAWLAAGWSGVVMLFGAAVALAVGLLAWRLRRQLSPLPAFLVLLLAAACVAPGFLARPHVLVLAVLLPWVLGLIEAAEQGGRPPWRLLPLMALWANLHASFILGLALVPPFAWEALPATPLRRAATARRWALFLLAAVGMALLTPQGWHGLVFPFQLTGMQHLLDIGEWRPPDFSRFQPLELALLALLYVALTRGLVLPLPRLLILLCLLHMTLGHQRYQLQLGLIGAAILAAPLGRALGEAAPGDARGAAPPRWACAGVLALALAAGAARLAWPLQRGDSPNAPVSALRQVPESVRRTPVLNDYGFGGFLIFSGVRPFIDGRADMYGDRFLADYVAALKPDPAAFQALVERYGVRWIILGAGSPALGMIDALPQWHRLYADGTAVVYLRQDS
jgi:hypothetical protein